MKEYRWRDGFPKPPIEANIFGEVVERLKQKTEAEGAVAAEIVAEARDPQSPLHPAFDWDDAAAAEKHRLRQARDLLSGLQTVIVKVETGETISSRAYHVVRSDERREYVAAEIIATNADYRAQVIKTAKRELEALLSKYERTLALVAYVPRLREIIDTMRDDIDQLATDATRRRAPRQKQSDQRPAATA